MSRRRGRRRQPRQDTSPLDDWVPRTRLGRLVKEGHVNSLEEVLRSNYVVRESEIVDMLFPDLRQEVVDVSLVQRQSDSGQQKSFRITVVVGNGEGVIGIGIGKASEFVPAVRAAEVRAKLNITMFRRGCGSWECGCKKPHTVPFSVNGKSGSVEVTFRPAPHGIGLATGDVAKKILELAGVKDCWAFTKGQTKTIVNYAKAVFDALKKNAEMRISQDEIKKISIMSGSIGPPPEEHKSAETEA